jgi:hypothetical protein
MNLRRGLSRTLILSALALAAAAPSAQAARGMEIGVQDDGQLLSNNPAVRQAALNQARALGAAAIRSNVLWASMASDARSTTAPAEPTYDFGRYDRLVDEAAAYGIKVQLSLAGPAPAWASGNHKVSNVKPNAARFGQFAGAVATHFRGRVRAISVWNEPNWHSLLVPEKVCRKVGKKKKCAKTSAKRYRALYQAAYSAIKAADPAVKIWIGETSPYDKGGRRKRSTAPLLWQRQMVCVDKVVRGCKGTLKADAYAHHPYAFDRPPSKAFPGKDNVTLGSLGKLRKQLKKLKKKIKIPRGTPLYLTEFAYFSTGPRALSQKKRAKFTRAAYERALKQPKVRQLVHYQIVDPPASDLTVGWRSGLITEYGVAHSAYRALVGFAAARASKLTLPGGPLGLPAAPTASASALDRFPPPFPLPVPGVPLL